jgi:hypothetical protein
LFDDRRSPTFADKAKEVCYIDKEQSQTGSANEIQREYAFGRLESPKVREGTATQKVDNAKVSSAAYSYAKFRSQRTETEG